VKVGVECDIKGVVDEGLRWEGTERSLFGGDKSEYIGPRGTRAKTS
jgi:hypothetical protein